MNAIEPRWPEHLQELLESLRGGGSGDAEAARGEAWLLLNTALVRSLRARAARFPTVSREDLEDIAAQRALELLQRAESGEWTVRGRSGPEIRSFVATVARNGLVDWFRKTGRREVPLDPEPGRESPDGDAPSRQMPDDAASGREFVEALRGCVEQLALRQRRVWFFRVLLEIPSKEIAAHPDLGLKPGHVDVLVQRSRDAIRACMELKGHRPRDMPPGTFVRIWETFFKTTPAGPEGEDNV
jgi:RNA polymerase sigma factor (sigma-70 family)